MYSWRSSSVTPRTSEPACRLGAGLGVPRKRRDVLRVETPPRAGADRAREPGVKEGEEALTVTGVFLEADRVTLGRERLEAQPRSGALAQEVPVVGLAASRRVG